MNREAVWLLRKEKSFFAWCVFRWRLWIANITNTYSPLLLTTRAPFPEWGKAQGWQNDSIQMLGGSWWAQQHILLMSPRLSLWRFSLEQMSCFFLLPLFACMHRGLAGTCSEEDKGAVECQEWICLLTTREGQWTWWMAGCCHCSWLALETEGSPSYQRQHALQCRAQETLRWDWSERLFPEDSFQRKPSTILPSYDIHEAHLWPA